MNEPIKAILIALTLGSIGGFVGILLYTSGVIEKPADWYLYGVAHAYITLWVVQKYIEVSDDHKKASN